jgi:hypothetical protein
LHWQEIDERCNTGGSRHQFTQELQLLRRQLTIEKIDTCQVAARPGEAGDKSKPDRVVGAEEDDGDRGGCRRSSVAFGHLRLVTK